MLAAYATNLVKSTEDPFTRDGFHLEVTISDSKGATKPNPGRTLPLGIAEEFIRNTSTFSPITTGNLNYMVTNGTFLSEYLFQLNALTGEKVRHVLCAVGGSQLYDASNAALSWRNDGVGTLWPLHSGYISAAMTEHGVTRVKRVHVILSINDMNDAARLTASINADWIDLIDRIIALCDPLEIWLNITGQVAQPNAKRVANVLFEKTLATTYVNRVFVINNEYMLFKCGGNDDGIHLNDNGNDHLGYDKAQAVAAKKFGISDNDLLSLLYGNFWNPLTTASRSAWTEFMEDCKSVGNYPLINSFQVRRADTRMNALTDFTRHTCGEDGGFTFFAKDRVLYDGVSNRINTWYNPSLYVGLTSATQSDFCYFVKTAESLTAAGVLATLYGQTSSAVTRIQQTAASTIIYSANGTNATWTGSATIPANSWIFVTRTGTTISIIVNGVTVHTATISGGTSTGGNMHEGCRATALTTSEYWNGAVYCSGYAAFTGFNISAMMSQGDTLLLNLAA